MKLSIYQVDAFTDKLFGGNPAAIIPLDEWIEDKLMQQLAMENNLSETVFFVPVKHTAAAGKDREGVDFDIRWFTPGSEINLCGHATLASAFLLYNYLNFRKEKLVFHSQSGKLEVAKKGDLFIMEFPSWKPKRIEKYPGNLRKALDVDEIYGIYKQRDLLVLLNREEEVQNAKPDFSAIKKWNEKVIITAPGSGDADFVSRFFAPCVGIDEDPVTGSAHSQLIPFWAERLGKQELFARQLSARGGELWCRQLDNRVSIAGKCVFYMKGEINI